MSTVDKDESTLINFNSYIYIYIYIYILQVYSTISLSWEVDIGKLPSSSNLLTRTPQFGRRCCFQLCKNFNAWLSFAWISSRHEIFNVVRVLSSSYNSKPHDFFCSRYFYFFFPGDILNFWPLPRVEKGNKYCYKPIDFILIWERCISVCLMLLIQHQYLGCLHLLACTSTNSTGPEVNDHVSLQWPSYEQPHGSNLRPQREQTS